MILYLSHLEYSIQKKDADMRHPQALQIIAGYGHVIKTKCIAQTKDEKLYVLVPYNLCTLIFFFIKPSKGCQTFPSAKFQSPVANHGGPEHVIIRS